ncbi:DUF4998 domain-containing protein [Gaoshiqia sp. Z1-71]|uniref:DUF4998 domain-containing protein n=1 Tax=Gaoshiqia hydrogeniformans TaxID=3290090 RepID=UPI003BF8049D
MKKRKIIDNSLFVLALFAMLVSCEDMMDVHKEYIEGGEIVYAPKPDSIAFHSGKGRILFRYWLYNSPNVASVDICWNNGANSMIIPVTPGTGLDSSDVLLENLPEKSYTFDVRTTDKYGNTSLVVTNFGTSYGDSYASTLFQRKIKSVSAVENGYSIQWYSAAESLVETQVRYETDNDTKIVRVPAGDDIVICPDAKGGSFFDYRSLYIPEEGAIDTFILEWTPYETAFLSVFKYDRSGWSVVTCSDQQVDDGGGVGTLLDGDFDSYWHSAYSEGAAPLPHWAIIDLNEAKSVCKIETWRPGNDDANTVQYWTSNDPDPEASSWEKIAEGVFPDGDLLTLEFGDSGVSVKRYLKLVLPDSNRVTYTSISEVFLYGK